MPKRRPKLSLEKLGNRIRTRRLFVNRTLVYVARESELSTSQLHLYETGVGHPPAWTLHRIAMVLGVSTSELLGERITQETLEQFDTLARVYADPFIGSVTRSMQDMDVSERRAMARICASVRSQKVETAKVMK
jgi:transcriptional regulator with XRE-family HTH domain